MKMVLFLAAILAFSCNDSKKQSFSGGAPTSKVEAADAFPEAEIELESCTDDTEGVTQATLLTDEITNMRTRQYIRYELFVTDCEGNVKELDGAIAFDVLARLSPFGAAIDYKVFEGEADEEISRGKLNIAKGKDLFGNVGDTYGFYQTKSLNVSTGVQSIILELDVSGMSFTPAEDDVDSLTYDIETYLSVGDTNPIEKKVTFVTILE